LYNNKIIDLDVFELAKIFPHEMRLPYLLQPGLLLPLLWLIYVALSELVPLLWHLYVALRELVEMLVSVCEALTLRLVPYHEMSV